MTWELLALLALIIGSILLGGSSLALRIAKLQRDLEATEWRSECDRALDRRRAELEAMTLEELEALTLGERFEDGWPR